jgi:hypothetical protein
MDDELQRHRKDWEDSPEEIDRQDRIGALLPYQQQTGYAEKYANFRHFDNLRWQTPALVALVGSAIAAFAQKSQDGLPNRWILFGYGLFAIAGGYTMHRVRASLELNNVVLRRFAIAIGDYYIPKLTKNKISAAFWVEMLLYGFGIAALIASFA